MNFRDSAVALLKNQLIDNCKTRYIQFINRNIVIWGTGVYGKFIFSLLKDFGLESNVRSFCDSFHNDSQNDFVCAKPVYSPSKNVELYPDAVYIIASDYYEDILKTIKESSYSNITTYLADYNDNLLEKQLIYFSVAPNEDSVVGFTYKWIERYQNLKENGSLDKMMDFTFSLLSDQKSKDIIKNRIDTFLTGDMTFINRNPIDPVTYFSDDYFKIGENEVLFDCGAFTGDTILDFVKFTNGKYQKIVSFEPDDKNLKKLFSVVENNDLKNIIVKKVATGNSHGKISFLNTGNMGAKVLHNTDNGNSVDLVKLDDYIDEKPTIIKMDIEGAELDSLKGASEIITTFKPKLAICIYHLITDFYDIPKFLHELVPEYKFKVRQHEAGFCETVLYAYI